MGPDEIIKFIKEPEQDIFYDINLHITEWPEIKIYQFIEAMKQNSNVKLICLGCNDKKSIDFLIMLLSSQASLKTGTLEKLRLLPSTIKDQDLLEIFKAINQNPHLKALDISEGSLINYNLLSLLLENNTTLQTLSINKIPPLSMSSLVEGMWKNTTLQVLNIHNLNQEIIFFHLAQMLEVNTTLRELNFLECQLDNLQLDALANSLHKNKGLKKLVVSHQKISSPKIFEALIQNTTLESVEFSGEFHWPTISEAFVGVLYNNKVIRALRFDEHSFSDRDFSNFYSAISKNPSLLEFGPVNNRSWKDKIDNFRISLFLSRNAQFVNAFDSLLSSQEIDSGKIQLLLEMIKKNGSHAKDYYFEIWLFLMGLNHIAKNNIRLALHYLLPTFDNPLLLNKIPEYLAELILLYEDEKSFLGQRYKLLAYFGQNLKEQHYLKVGLLGMLHPEEKPNVSEFQHFNLKELFKVDQLINITQLQSLVMESIRSLGDIAVIEERIFGEMRKTVLDMQIDWFKPSTRKDMAPLLHDLVSLQEKLLKPLISDMHSILSLHHDESVFLREFLQCPGYHPEILTVLGRSQVFIEQLKKKFPGKKSFALIENVILHCDAWPQKNDILDITDLRAPVTALDVEYYQNNIKVNKMFTEALYKMINDAYAVVREDCMQRQQDKLQKYIIKLEARGNINSVRFYSVPRFSYEINALHKLLIHLSRYAISDAIDLMMEEFPLLTIEGEIAEEIKQLLFDLKASVGDEFVNAEMATHESTLV